MTFVLAAVARESAVIPAKAMLAPAWRTRLDGDDKSFALSDTRLLRRSETTRLTPSADGAVMSPLNQDFSPIRLATKNLPLQARVEQWHEVVGRDLLRLDSEPLRDSPVEFDADITLRLLPGMRVAIGAVGGSMDRRTRELTHDGNDDVVLLMNLCGPLSISQRRCEVTAHAGDSVVLTCAEPAKFSRPQPGRVLALFLSRAGLAPLVDNLDDVNGRVPVQGVSASRLLSCYMQSLDDLSAGVDVELGQSIVRHIFDLSALVIGARKGFVDTALGGGANAARLRILKSDIIRNAGSPLLSVATLANRHGMTQRQLQRLFEKESLTFSSFLLETRLMRARRLLATPSSTETRISEIAFACGFGDLSYFNRAFRARYGCTPKDIRTGGNRFRQ